MWSNKKTKADAEKPNPNASPKVQVLHEDDIRQIVIKRRGSEIHHGAARRCGELDHHRA